MRFHPVAEWSGSDDDILVIDTDVVVHVVRQVLATIRRFGAVRPGIRQGGDAGAHPDPGASGVAQVSLPLPD